MKKCNGAELRMGKGVGNSELQMAGHAHTGRGAAMANPVSAPDDWEAGDALVALAVGNPHILSRDVCDACNCCARGPHGRRLSSRNRQCLGPLALVYLVVLRSGPGVPRRRVISRNDSRALGKPSERRRAMSHAPSNGWRDCCPMSAMEKTEISPRGGKPRSAQPSQWM